MKLQVNKLFKTGLIISVLAIVLAGCGGLTPKEEYAGAYAEINEAETIEVGTNVSFEVDGEGLDLNPEEVSLFNSLTLNTNIKSDIEQAQHELHMDIGASVGPIDMNLEMPMYIDGETNKMYTKAEGFVDMVNSIAVFSGFPVNIEAPEEIHGKVLELSTEDVDSRTAEQEAEAMENLVRQSRAFLEELPEDSFTKEEDIISYTVSGDEVINMVLDLFESNPALLDEAEAPVDVNEMRAALEETAIFGEVKVDAVMDDGSVAKETMEIPMTIADSGASIQMTLHVVNTYNQINGELDFTFDLSEENIITEEELDEVMNEAMSGFGF